MTRTNPGRIRRPLVCTTLSSLEIDVQMVIDHNLLPTTLSHVRKDVESLNTLFGEVFFDTVDSVTVHLLFEYDLRDEEVE